MPARVRLCGVAIAIAMREDDEFGGAAQVAGLLRLLRLRCIVVVERGDSFSAISVIVAIGRAACQARLIGQPLLDLELGGGEAIGDALAGLAVAVQQVALRLARCLMCAAIASAISRRS